MPQLSISPHIGEIMCGSRRRSTPTSPLVIINKSPCHRTQTETTPHTRKSRIIIRTSQPIIQSFRQHGRYCDEIKCCRTFCSGKHEIVDEKKLVYIIHLAAVTITLYTSFLYTKNKIKWGGIVKSCCRKLQHHPAAEQEFLSGWLAMAFFIAFALVYIARLLKYDADMMRNRRIC